ncbi:hypothetical protein B7463_g6442, partial [Scytalidium lignicola]
MEPSKALGESARYKLKSEGKFSDAGKRGRKRRNSEILPSPSSQMTSDLSADRVYDPLSSTLIRERGAQEKKRCMEAALTIFGDAIHQSFKFVRGPLYTGEWSSEYETIMSVEELMEEWNKFENRNKGESEAFSSYVGTLQQVDPSLEKTQAQELVIATEKDGEQTKEILLSLKNSTSNISHQNKLASINERQQYLLTMDNHTELGPTARSSTNETTRGSVDETSNYEGNLQPKMNVNNPQKSPNSIDEDYLDDSNAFSNDPDFMYLPKTVWKQPEFPNDYNSEIDILPALFPDRRNQGTLALSSSLRKVGQSPRNFTIKQPPWGSKNVSVYSSRATTDVVLPDEQFNNHIGQTHQPNRNYSYHSNSQHTHSFPVSQINHGIVSSHHADPRRSVSQAFQHMPPVQYLPAYQVDPGVRFPQYTNTAREGVVNPLQYLPIYITNPATQNVWFQHHNNQGNKISEYSPHPSYTLAPRTDQVVRVSQDINSGSDKPRSVQHWSRESQKDRKRGRGRRRALPSEIVDLSERAITNTTPMDRCYPPDSSGNSTGTFSQPQSMETAVPSSPITSPIKFNLPVPSEKIMKRESVVIQFTNGKQREGAIELLENTAKSEGRDVKVVEDFMPNSSTVMANGPIGSNTRGFVQKLFPNARVTATIN